MKLLMKPHAISEKGAKMLIIYDKTGEVYFAGTGKKEPEELEHITAEVPSGTYFAGMDTSGDTLTPIFKNIPKTDIEILQEQVQQLQAQSELLAAQNAALIDGINAMTGAAEIEGNGGAGV